MVGLEFTFMVLWHQDIDCTFERAAVIRLFHVFLDLCN